MFPSILSGYLLLLIASSEELTYTNSTPPETNVIQCNDPNSQCIINCNSPHVCSNHDLHCHTTSQIACVINLNAEYAAQSAIVQTHSSANVTINGHHPYCGANITVNAYESLGTQLFIDVPAGYALQDGYIYGPLGHNSLLSMICGYYSCYNMRIYDDWSTTVRLQAVAQDSFKDTQIRNLFDVGGLDLIRSDYGTGASLNYRASVYLLDCTNQKDAFDEFQYHGVNHGAYYIRVGGSYALFAAVLSFITDNRVDQSVKFPVKIYSASSSNLRRGSFTFGVGADVFIQVHGDQGLWYQDIYARNANSLTIYCRNTSGKVCGRLNIELPQNNNPNSFNWICDSPANCWDDNQNYLEIDNAYDCSNYYISSRVEARIYCGYNQTTEYCDLYPNHTVHCQEACGAECAFDNVITPTSIATEMDAFCSSTTVTIDTLEPTAITTNSSPDPTTSPSHPSSDPNKPPSNDPTASFSLTSHTTDRIASSHSTPNPTERPLSTKQGSADIKAEDVIVGNVLIVISAVSCVIVIAVLIYCTKMNKTRRNINAEMMRTTQTNMVPVSTASVNRRKGAATSDVIIEANDNKQAICEINDENIWENNREESSTFTVADQEPHDIISPNTNINDGE